MTVTIYNRTEARLKKRIDAVTTVLFRPFVRFADRLHITPNLVSFSGFLVALLFFVQLAVLRSTQWTVHLIVLYVFLDNFDGTLSRARGMRQSGVFVDVYFDMASLVVGSVALIGAGMLPVFTGVVFLVFYVAIMWGGFVATGSGMSAPIARPRSVLFVCYVTNIIAGRQVLEFALFVGLAVCAQLVSLVSLALVLIRGREKLRWPGITAELGPGTRAMMATALILLIPVCAWVFFVRSEPVGF